MTVNPDVDVATDSMLLTIWSARSARTAGSFSMSVVVSAKPCELANVRHAHSETMARFEEHDAEDERDPRSIGAALPAVLA